jgi:tetratricopeptide (TPR) repeat protein/serine/threonine protein kinase
MAADGLHEQAIFEVARKIDSREAREAYLQQVCGQDETLLRRVRALLRALEENASFLEAPPSALGVEAARTIDQLMVEPQSTVIGPYKLLQQIGEGGMGSVFMAEQTQPVQRKVALKLVKPGMDSRQVIARFEQERQALAMMDHPNIARVHDAGTTAAGRPYFVMELVKGVPITRYCDEHRLTPRQRLELLVPICQAVQHAHQKGIIHRDLKPSNVLVAEYDDRPVAKVIDFGIAKATGARLTERTMFTEFGQVVGTLEYMSPEQAKLNALDIDTRSDIYALGVLLYELLTGTTPFEKTRLPPAAFDEMLRIIREEEPPRPSIRISTLGQAASTMSAQRQSDPRKLSQLCRGELDWIVMKCLEKDRNRRYDSASALARDIERYLHDEPVQACPPSAMYRLRKLVRRNKVTLGVAALVLVFLVLLGAGSGWVLRDRSGRRAEAAQQAGESLQRARAWMSAGNLALARQELAEARGRIGSDRAVLVALAEEINTLDGALARFQRFFDLVEQAHDAEASMTSELAQAETGAGTKPAPAAVRFSANDPAKPVPFHLQALACYQVLEREDWLAGLEGGLGQAAQVQQVRRSVYEELLWLVDDNLARRRDHRSGERLSLAAAGRQGLLYLHKAEQAWQPTLAFYRFRALCRHALGEKEAASADEVLARKTPPAMAVDHYLLGRAARNAKDRAEAIKQFEAALRLEPADYWSLMNLGGGLCELGEQERDFAAAAAALTGCILRRPDHAAAWNNRGIAHSNLRQYDNALADFSKAIKLKPDYAGAWNNRGNAYDALGQYDSALADYSKAIELKPDDAVTWTNRAVVYRSLRRYDKALADYSKAIELKPDYANAWNNRGALSWELGRYDQAVADCSKAIALKPNYAEPWYNRGIAHRKLRQYDQAIADYSKAIERKPDYARAWNSRGIVFCDDLKQYAKAVADFSKAIELKPDDAQAWDNRGNAYRGLRQYDKAVADYSKAIEVKPDYAWAWINRGGIFCDVLKEYDKAVADFSRAIALEPKNAPAWYNRGTAHNNLRQYDRAIADYSRAIALKPNLAEAWYSRGTAHSNLGQYDKALADYSKAIELIPKHAYAHNTLAWLLANCPESKFRDPRRAVELAKRAIHLGPKNGNYWNTLGLAQYRAGCFQEAVAALEKSMALRNGGNSFDWFFLAMAHWQLGDKDQARQWYDRAVRWMETNAPQNDELRRFRTEAAQLMNKESEDKNQESGK